MNFGEYIKRSLQEKSVSLSELSEKIGFKSRSVFYRMFEGRCSYDKASELINKIMEHVDFDEDESRKIRMLMEEVRTEKFYIEARKILSNIYKTEIETGFECNDHSLSKILEKHRLQGDVANVIIADVDDIRIIGDLNIELSKKNGFRVYHYIQLKRHNLMTAYEILAMIILSKHNNYFPIIVSDKKISGLYILNEHGTTSLAAFEKNDGVWNSVYTEISRVLYDYLINRKDIYDRNGIILKERMHRVIDYVKFVEDSMVFDNNLTYYSEGAICFSCIDAEIIISMFKDIGYFGFPEDHPYVKELIAVYRKRAEIFNGNKAGKRILLDNKHMEDMLKSGLSANHVEHFKPLTKQQMRAYFNGLINNVRERPEKMEFKFLKDMTITDSYVYGVNQIFHIYYPTNEERQGFSMMLNNSAVNEIMTDFTEYVWENMTYSVEESIGILEGMMDKYL